ncbi:MAG TPA: DUF6065 family protein [Solirubrobacteraceae bacterium]|jgi:hypothetical protein
MTTAGDNKADTLVAYVGRKLDLDIVPAPRTRDWMLKTTKSFANRCLPLLMANESGWWLRNAHSFTAVWNGGAGRADIDLVFDERNPRGNTPNSTFGSGIISWPISCVFRTPPGVDLLVRGPANLPKDGATALEGLVEADWMEVTFTMNWQLTRPGLAVRFERDEPFAMVVPQVRTDLERYKPVMRPMSDNPQLKERIDAFLAGRRREHIRAFASEHVPGIGGREWDGSYMRGERSDGLPFQEHRVRRELRPFERPPSTEADPATSALSADAAQSSPCRTDP